MQEGKENVGIGWGAQAKGKVPIRELKKIKNKREKGPADKFAYPKFIPNQKREM